MAKAKTPARFVRLYARKKKYWNATQTEARRGDITEFVEIANERFPGAFSFRETSNAFFVEIDKGRVAKGLSLIERVKLFFSKI